MSNEEAKLFVAGLHDSVSEDVLRQLFEAAGGKVVAVSIPKDRMTGRPRGFGFVTMSTPEEAQSARSALDGSVQGGKTLSVRPAEKVPPKRDGGGPGFGGGGGPRGGGGFSAKPYERTLYIGNLPYDCSENEISDLINRAVPGGVSRVTLLTDQEGRKKGNGFVEMSTTDAAKSAVDALRNAELKGRRLRVDLARPPGERPPREPGGFHGGHAGGGGGFGGGGPALMGPPAQPSRKFEDRKRKQHGAHDDGGGPRRGGGGGGGKRGREERYGGRIDDYDDD